MALSTHMIAGIGLTRSVSLRRALCEMIIASAVSAKVERSVILTGPLG